jgi:hypothetical protein
MIVNITTPNITNIYQHQKQLTNKNDEFIIPVQGRAHTQSLMAIIIMDETNKESTMINTRGFILISKNPVDDMQLKLLEIVTLNIFNHLFDDDQDQVNSSRVPQIKTHDQLYIKIKLVNILIQSFGTGLEIKDISTLYENENMITPLIFNGTSIPIYNKSSNLLINNLKYTRTNTWHGKITNLHQLSRIDQLDLHRVVIGDTTYMILLVANNHEVQFNSSNITIMKINVFDNFNEEQQKQFYEALGIITQQ